MQKIHFICLFFLFAAVSCKNKVTNNVTPTVVAENNSIIKEEVVTETIPALLGSYVGAFGDNKITVLISKATKDSVRGRSIVGGYDRPFEGTLSSEKNLVHIVAKEPGDDKHDGTFNFTINNENTANLSGSWKPFKETAEIKGKEFKLDKKSFAYLKTVGQYPQASSRMLKEDDVNNLLKDELEQMRNEIYARHGYCFTRKTTRQQFERFDWYIPNSTDIKKDITAIEKANITLIKKFEKYAEEYGDDYGR
jgi:YARHG domain